MTEKESLSLKTCRSASETECWGRNQHPFYLSDSPAFSGNKEGWKKLRCCSSSHLKLFPNMLSVKLSPAAHHCCLHWGWRFLVWVWRKPLPLAHLKCTKKWNFTCSQLLSGTRLSRRERPWRQCDSNLYKHWSFAAPSLQPRGCGVGTAGTEAVVSPSLFPVKQRRRRKTAETPPSELHCPPAVTHTHTHTLPFLHSVY